MNSIQELISIDYENEVSVRAVISNGEIYVCLRDVCKIAKLNSNLEEKRIFDKDSILYVEVIERGYDVERIFINQVNLIAMLIRRPRKVPLIKWFCKYVFLAYKKNHTYTSREIVDYLLRNPRELGKALISYSEEIEELNKKYSKLKEYTEKLETALGNERGGY